MSIALRRSAVALCGAVAFALSGCASSDGTGGLLSTGSLTEQKPAQTAQAQPKIDPACVTLTSQIETLRKEGIAEKIEKAAAKKHKMTTAELTKANELNKANAEFQAKCSTLSPKPTTAQPAVAPPAGPTAPQAAAPAAPTTQQAAAAATTAAKAAAKKQ